MIRKGFGKLMCYRAKVPYVDREDLSEEILYAQFWQAVGVKFPHTTRHGYLRIENFYPLLNRVTSDLCWLGFLGRK
jgi:hypothetical protein